MSGYTERREELERGNGISRKEVEGWLIASALAACGTKTN